MKTFRQFISEDTGSGAIAGGTTSSSSIQSFDPVIGDTKRKFKEFDVPEEVFHKFQKGRVRFERWGKYLNLEDEAQRDIYEFAKKNRGHVIILRNSANGAMRSIRARSSNNE